MGVWERASYLVNVQIWEPTTIFNVINKMGTLDPSWFCPWKVFERRIRPHSVQIQIDWVNEKTRIQLSVSHFSCPPCFVAPLRQWGIAKFAAVALRQFFLVLILYYSKESRSWFFSMSTLQFRFLTFAKVLILYYLCWLSLDHPPSLCLAQFRENEMKKKKVIWVAEPYNELYPSCWC